MGRTVINSDNGEIIEYTNYNRETSDFPGGQMAPPKNTQVMKGNRQTIADNRWKAVAKATTAVWAGCSGLSW